jgi:plastocyanin
MFLSRRSAQLSIVAIVFAVAASACGSSSSSPTTPTTSADVTIGIVGVNGANSFSPSPTTMKVGQTVAFKNNDTIAHDATQDAAKFNTGTLGAGATSSAIPMPTAGTFTYHCSIHPGMIGTITVQ